MAEQDLEQDQWNRSMVRDPVDDVEELTAKLKRRREATRLARKDVRRSVMQRVRMESSSAYAEQVASDAAQAQSSAKSRSTRSLSDIMSG